MKFLISTSILTLTFCSSLVWAQASLDQTEVVDIEALYRNQNTNQAKPVERVVEVNSSATQDNSSEVRAVNVKKVDDLNRLEAFSDISVIQKKYLPKTERFQLYAAGGLTTNSPWFLNLGAKLNFGYYFTESFGVELTGMFLTNSELNAAKDIKANHSLEPDKFVRTKSHVGLNLVWSPIYGKMTSNDNEITPFDMYFSIGAGSSNTNSVEKNVTTFQLGTGQIFAINKSTAFRWDYSWNFYQATPVPDASSTTAPSKGSYNDLVLTAGISFFFPEVSYR